MAPSASKVERDLRRVKRSQEVVSGAARPDASADDTKPVEHVSDDASRSEPSSSASSAVGRLTGILTPGGKFDVRRMTPATRENFKNALNDPDVRREFFGDAPALTLVPRLAPDGSTLVTPEQVAAFLYVFGGLQTWLVEWTWKIPHDVAARVMPYSDEETAAIAPPAAAVANKYLPEWFKKHADLMALISALGEITVKKIVALNQAVNASNARAASSPTRVAGAPGVQ